eukprot:SAG11_NODE_5614_length_1508_cov_1.034067_2_plen_157_part_00
MVCTTVYGMEEPYGLGVYTSSEVCEEEQINRCNFAALCFVFLGVGLGFAEYFKNMAYEAMSVHAAMNLRIDLFHSLIYKDIGYFDEPDNTSGALTSRLASDCVLVSGVLGPQVARCEASPALTLSSSDIPDQCRQTGCIIRTQAAMLEKRSAIGVI